MNALTDALNTVIRKAQPVRNPGDYIQDGLLYCGACRTPKQCRIRFGTALRVVGCQCSCAARRYEAERKAEQQRQELERIERLRASCIADRAVRGYTFASAEETPDLLRCKAYAQHLSEAVQENQGLLLWGNTGTGKTFAAACIANAALDRGIPAMVTSFPKILGVGWDARDKIIGQLNRYKLLVLDDLGAERQSDYALETVYRVVDERYKSGLPLIVTTNLPLSALTKPKNMDYQRIYDRVLELCTPLYFGGENRRRQKANANLKWLREVTG